MNNYFLRIIPFTTIAPFAFAQTTIKSIVSDIVFVVQGVTSVVSLLIIIAFIVQIVIFLSLEDSSKRAKAKKNILLNVLFMFIFISIWGILAFIRGIASF